MGVRKTEMTQGSSPFYALSGSLNHTGTKQCTHATIGQCAVLSHTAEYGSLIEGTSVQLGHKNAELQVASMPV